MDIQNIEKPRKSYWKFVFGFFGVILAVFILAIGGYWGWQKYDLWRKQIPKGFEETIKKLEQEDYERAMADTYGGKTPQETLQMYIDAVEKRDYELASKYLIEANRENENKELNALSNKNNIEWFIEVIKKAMPDGQITDTFRMKSRTDEGPYYFIRFKKYPNDIWKIIEI